MDRRTSARRRVSLAAELETDDGRKAIAVSRDVSESGLLLLTQIELPIGTPFRIFIVIPAEGDPAVAVSGRVVRCEPLELEYADVWSYKVGVELVDPPPQLATFLEDVTGPVD